jgi:photosystem II stability/assembly factor-like uncharacterized protein
VAALAGLLCAVPAAAETVLLEAGSAMSYLANTSDPGVDATWFLEDFVEGAEWTAGVYGVGHENGPPGAGAHDLIVTAVTGPVNSIYTRTSFELTGAGNVFSLFYGSDYDDGTVVWINGVEVYRSPEMRNRNLTWQTAAGPHESSNGTEPDYTPLRDITDAALPVVKNGVNVVAIGVWNNTNYSDDLVLVPQIVIDREPRRGPYLQQATPDSVIVRWRTGASGGSRVVYGTDPGALTSEVTVGGSRTEHEVTLSGLEPGTRYYYGVGTPSAILAGGDAEHFFLTPPPAGRAVPTRIWVLGDSGAGTVPAQAVRDAYYAFTDDVAHGGAGARHTDLLLMLGDNAYPQGTEQEYQNNLFDIYSRSLRQSVLWPTIGNHDTPDESVQSWPYYDIFSLPTQGEAGGVGSGTEQYYSFDHGNIHFVVLNSMEAPVSGFGAAMLSWLEADLQDATEDWIIAYWHHPPYSKGGHDSDDPSDSMGRLMWMRENALPVLDDYGVDLVFSGHSHSYERSYLIDGHYGDSSTFVEGMKVDVGDGNANGGDGAYVKPYRGAVPYAGAGDGAVYTVAGCASHLTPGHAEDLGGTEPNHPVMVLSLLQLGSVVLDVNGNRLDAIFLDDSGSVRDEYTMFKGGPTELPEAEFTASPRAALAPSVVGFTDLTLNGPTAWAWDFDGDGEPDSAQPMPTHEFTQPGLHAVGLTASNSAGTDEELKADYVCVTSGVPGAVTGLSFDTDPAVFFWTAAPGAMFYDAVRGDLPALVSGDAGSLDLTCLEDDGGNLQSWDAAEPGPGGGYFYLAGGSNCAGEQGSYDSSGGAGPAVSRDALVQPVCATCATGADDDGDEVCAGQDNCPGVANPGQQDGDGDGAGDACDGCPSDPGKASPGQCGCGVADTDSDGDGTADCVDGCPSDPNKVEPGLCGCGVPDVDSDNDGALDCVDGCPSDPDKVEPGLCGCGVPDTDSDGDATPDCLDGCPSDPDKVAPGVCGCGEPDTDSDDDATPDCLDGCPSDPDKVAPGVCGCGEPDTDSDGDTTADCIDGCPNDPGKVDPGVCGCGIADTDNDDDGWPNCIDQCPDDPDKIEPGICGCGVADADGDSDGTPDCVDGCPSDPNKIAPGLCGCGDSECWIQLISGTGNDLKSVHFVDDQTGYAVGASGTIVKTDNGGFSWTAQDSGTQAILEAVEFRSTARGFVVGRFGRILGTLDGGQNWTVKVSGTLLHLHDVDFVGDTGTGYVVGEGGLILKTVDDGNTWAPQDSTTQRTLRSVHFPVDASVGYIVGDGGTVLKTTNGGHDWRFQNTPTSQDLTAVQFPEDAVTGYAVGVGGTILKTTSAGFAWVGLTSGTPVTLRGVSFPRDALTGLVVGGDGVARKTVDGGWSWIPRNAAPGFLLHDVHLPEDISRGYAVGSNGVILRWLVE